MRFITLLILLVSVLSAEAQTINEHIENITPDSRYTVHTDGTVTDTETRLMWKQCPEGLSGNDCNTGSANTFTWKAALEQAKAASDAGYTDWRLPNVKELGSLVALDRYRPSINLTIFPNTPASYFWSGSPFAFSSNYAWFVYFYHGYGSNCCRSSSYHVRLVRDVGAQ
ncbi:DUF1566 domain-containing protein [Marinomonas balearica]|uniref:Uncharacterized protein DUF1566 n=1 Tax=Marinomonas balearica TaxID=491947 RepID=A0A4R6MDX1_9GAMM|nr:DUF1566 domain-containing protein [Marinomonas balearica]TDO99941.1 uncharacterized protein DUF1566 [Marinomonas balearica]